MIELKTRFATTVIDAKEAKEAIEHIRDQMSEKSVYINYDYELNKSHLFYEWVLYVRADSESRKTQVETTAKLLDIAVSVHRMCSHQRLLEN